LCPSATDVEDPLLAESRETLKKARIPNATVLQLMKTAELRRPLWIVTLAMLCQQFSGMLPHITARFVRDLKWCTTGINAGDLELTRKLR
jgi:hypothetical protein